MEATKPIRLDFCLWTLDSLPPRSPVFRPPSSFHKAPSTPQPIQTIQPIKPTNVLVSPTNTDPAHQHGSLPPVPGLSSPSTAAQSTMHCRGQHQARGTSHPSTLDPGLLSLLLPTLDSPALSPVPGLGFSVYELRELICFFRKSTLHSH